MPEELTYQYQLISLTGFLFYELRDNREDVPHRF